MARPKKAAAARRKPRAAVTADAVCEMVAYMQRERHLILHAVKRLDALEREVRRLGAERTNRTDWERLNRQVENLRDDFRRVHGTPAPLPHSPR